MQSALVLQIKNSLGVAALYTIYLYETTAAAAFDPLPEMQKSFFFAQRHESSFSLYIKAPSIPVYLYVQKKHTTKQYFLSTSKWGVISIFSHDFLHYMCAVIRGRSSHSILMEENYDNLHSSQLLLFWNIRVDNQIWITDIKSTVHKNLNLNSYWWN